MTEGVVLAVTGLMLLLTVLPLWKNPAWWVRGLDFPRLQLGFLLLVLLGVQVYLWPRSPGYLALSLVTLACMGYQLWWIMPYSRLWRLEVKPAEADSGKPRIRLMAANVLTPNRHADRLLALVEKYQPDVLVAVETDRWWESQLDQLAGDYPHCIRCPLDNLYGMHVYSRLPLEDPQVAFLVEPDVPSMHARLRVNPQLSIRMHFLHPAPPSPTENDESTERDVELLVVAKSVQDDKGPIIVTGDLNDVAWSPTTRLFRKISGLLDPRIGRGLFNTFHACHWFLRWPLDHFFHSAHFKVVRIVRLPAFGSDHFPIFIELEYDDEHTEEQESLEADAHDQREAEEKIRSKGVSEEDVPQPGKR